MSPKSIFSRLDTVILRVRDVKMATAWYQEALGFSCVYSDDHERLAVMQVDPTASITLWQLTDGEIQTRREHAGTYPIFAVEEAEQARRTLSERGVEVETIQEGTGVRTFRFWDPDGNALEACQVLASENEL